MILLKLKKKLRDFLIYKIKAFNFLDLLISFKTFDRKKIQSLVKRWLIFRCPSQEEDISALKYVSLLCSAFSSFESHQSEPKHVEGLPYLTLETINLDDMAKKSDKWDFIA